MDSLPALLEHRARATPDALAYAFVDGAKVTRRTWAELARRARGVAARLEAAGLAPGDRALLLFPEGMDFLDALFGCLAGGVLAVPVHPPDPRRLARTLPRAQSVRDDCGPRAVLTVPALTSAIAGLAGGLPVLLPRDEDGPPRTAPGPEMLAYLQYTSGSTGDPRGVMVDHGNLVRQLETFDEGYGHGPDAVIVSWLPATHDLGLVYGRLMGLFKGIPTVFLDPAAVIARPRAWFEALTAWRGTHTPTPNFGLDVAATRIDDLAGLDLRAVRVIVNGAEPIRRASEVRFHERFRTIGLDPRALTHAMGMSEATAKIVSEPIDREGRFLALDPDALARGHADPSGGTWVASNGSPCGDTRICVVDPDTRQVLQDGRVGELWVAGRTVARGYWNRPEATEATFRARTSAGQGPFLRTGDLGFLHEGELYLVGRSKDVIVVRGQNLHPHDLEAAVEGAHPALRPGGAAAFAVTGPDGAEGIGLVAELTADPPRPDEVFAALRGALSDLGLAADVLALIPRGSLPKTSSGKLQRAATRVAFAKGSLPVLHRQVRGSAPISGSLDVWVREAAGLLGIGAEDVQSDRPLRELGLDSVSAVTLIERVGRALGRDLPVTAIWDHPTLAGLAAAFGASRPADHRTAVAEMSDDEAEAALLAELEALGR